MLTAHVSHIIISLASLWEKAMYRQTAVIAAIMVMLTLPALAQIAATDATAAKKGGGGKGAPLTLVGTGLPMLVLVGGGYLLVRRLRKAD
jgi:hypothetical protein